MGFSFFIMRFIFGRHNGSQPFDTKPIQGSAKIKDDNSTVNRNV